MARTKPIRQHKNSLCSRFRPIDLDLIRKFCDDIASHAKVGGSDLGFRGSRPLYSYADRKQADVLREVVLSSFLLAREARA